MLPLFRDLKVRHLDLFEGEKIDIAWIAREIFGVKSFIDKPSKFVIESID
jgi:hypothetical protein